jgi:hypothetical protein
LNQLKSSYGQNASQNAPSYNPYATPPTQSSPHNPYTQPSPSYNPYTQSHAPTHLSHTTGSAFTAYDHLPALVKAPQHVTHVHGAKPINLFDEFQPVDKVTTPPPKEALTHIATLRQHNAFQGMLPVLHWHSLLGIDDYARHMPEGPPTLQAMAQALVACPLVRTPLDRVRVIFTWVATHVSYDVPLFHGPNEPKIAKVRSQYVYEHRATICAGYANLLHAMLLTVGIEAYPVSGVGAAKTAEVCSLIIPCSHD